MPRRRRKGSVKEPKAIEAQLARIFASYVSSVHKELLADLTADLRTDADPVTEMKAKFAQIQKQPLPDRILARISRLASRLIRSIDRQLIQNVPSIDQSKLVGYVDTGRIVEQNVNLIKQLGAVHLGELTETFNDPLFRALSTDAKAEILQNRLGATRSKAKFWAVDQTLKNNSEMTQRRARTAGLDRYEWVTSNDERVRDSHAELNGQVFRIGSPPSVGAPGEDYNCRCTMLLLPPEDP